jgi:hypothetical protein
LSFALAEGFRLVRRSFGLVFVTLGVNLALAALLALPLASRHERDLENSGAAVDMLYGFDTAWWSHWHESQEGPSQNFGPDLLGVGFAFKNLDLLLRGELPLGLFRAQPAPDQAAAGAGSAARLDGVTLGVAALSLLLQTFLLGGILGVLRGEQGGWTLRGLLHGSGFYFGRLLRVALLALALDYVLFRLYGPFARWADAQAREAVSESTATAWALSRHALLLFALLLINMLSSLAKVIVVLEDRSSALLAWLSALGFCAANLWKTAGHYFSLVALSVLLLAAWAAFDARLATTGYKSQLLALLLAQALMAGRIALRLSLFAGQIALYRRQTGS